MRASRPCRAPTPAWHQALMGPFGDRDGNAVVLDFQANPLTRFSIYSTANSDFFLARTRFVLRRTDATRAGGLYGGGW